MTTKPILEPNAENTFRIILPDSYRGADSGADLVQHIKRYPYDFAARADYARQLLDAGELEKACVVHFEGLDLITDVVSEDEPVVLDWEWEPNREVVEFVSLAATDLYMLGDFDPAAGIIEYLLDMDPEDHLGVSYMLAFCYVALKDYDSFDDILSDLSDKDAETTLVRLWAAQRRHKDETFATELASLKRNHAAVYNEFMADTHELTEEMIIDINSDRPSREAAAKDVWFKHQTLWELFPDFLKKIRG